MGKLPAAQKACHVPERRNVIWTAALVAQELACSSSTARAWREAAHVSVVSARVSLVARTRPPVLPSHPPIHPIVLCQNRPLFILFFFPCFARRAAATVCCTLHPDRQASKAKATPRSPSRRLHGPLGDRSSSYGECTGTTESRTTQYMYHRDPSPAAG